jgi:hypothetical protein
LKIIAAIEDPAVIVKDLHSPGFGAIDDLLVPG